MRNMVCLAWIIPFHFWLRFRVLMPRRRRFCRGPLPCRSRPRSFAALATAAKTPTKAFEQVPQGGARGTLATPKLCCHDAPTHRALSSGLLEIQLDSPRDNCAGQHMMDVFLGVAAGITSTQVEIQTRGVQNVPIVAVRWRVNIRPLKSVPVAVSSPPQGAVSDASNRYTIGDQQVVRLPAFTAPPNLLLDVVCSPFLLALWAIPPWSKGCDPMQCNNLMPSPLPSEVTVERHEVSQARQDDPGDGPEHQLQAKTMTTATISQ